MDEKVIVELRVVNALAKEHIAQVINYLYAGSVDDGLLINFGTPKMEYRRLERKGRNKAPKEASSV